MTLETVPLEGLNTFASQLLGHKVYESIAHIGHGSFVQRYVEEIEGSSKAQIRQLRNQLLHPMVGSSEPRICGCVPGEFPCLNPKTSIFYISNHAVGHTKIC